jgi:cell division protein FtsL
MTNLAGAFMTRPRTSIPTPGIDFPEIAPRIEVVPTRVQRRARPKIAYAAVVVTGVLAIVVTQLLLSIGLSDGAYEISSLQQQQKELDRSNQVLSEQYDKLSSPQNLAASAESLGMVANSAPVYLRLSDGAVLGSPVAASAGTPSLTGGQPLIPNALLAAPATTVTAPDTGTATTGAAPDAGTGATGANSAATSAPPVVEAQPDVPWQGALPSPTTR